MRNRGRAHMVRTAGIAVLAALAGMLGPAAAGEDAQAILEATGVKGGLIVHVGCGDGRLTAALHANDRYVVHGLDRDAANVAKARAHFRSLGLNLAEVSPLDRLSWLGTWTMGALTYHPPVVRESTDSSVFDLHDLGRQSQEILSGASVDVLPQLMRAGGSPGGARPKVLVGFDPPTGDLVSGEADLPDGFEHWIVKFAARTGTPDAGAVEYAYSLMAVAAGIDMPRTRLFETAEGERFFGTRRFDRDGNRRFHVHTFGNLIQSNFRIPSADYADLLKATSLLTRNHQAVLRAFRRMVFNVLAHNRDDHVKNFAFILDDSTGEWSLSPAYDLVFTPGPGGEHTMTLAGEGRNPGGPHVLRLAERAGLSRREAERIIGEVQASVSRWTDWATRAGVSAASMRQISASFLEL